MKKVRLAIALRWSPYLLQIELLGFAQRDSVSTATAEEATLSTSDQEKDVERSEKAGEQQGNTADIYNYKEDPENPWVTKRYYTFHNSSISLWQSSIW